MLPILADDASGGAIALIMALSGIVGGAVVWVGKYFNDRRKEQRTEQKEDEKGIVSHMEKLNARLDREAAAQRQENNVLRSNLTMVVAHVRYLEGIMESKQIQFRPFDLNLLDTRTHRALEANGSGEGEHGQ